MTKKQGLEFLDEILDESKSTVTTLDVNTTAAKANAAKASGNKKIVGGDKKRVTVLIRLNQLDDMDRIGRKVGLSRNGFIQWGIDLALEAAAKGQVPPMEDFVRRRYAGGK